VDVTRRIELIAEDLVQAGQPERVVEKIIGGNFHRLFADVWGTLRA
jgi:membrane dipeptidase